MKKKKNIHIVRKYYSVHVHLNFGKILHFAVAKDCISAFLDSILDSFEDSSSVVCSEFVVNQPCLISRDWFLMI